MLKSAARTVWVSSPKPDQVDAGVGDIGDGGEGYVAGDFEHHAAARDLDGAADVVEIHVVEQDDIGAGCDCLFKLGVGFAFDFDFQGMRADCLASFIAALTEPAAAM